MSGRSPNNTTAPALNMKPASKGSGQPKKVSPMYISVRELAKRELGQDPMNRTIRRWVLNGVSGQVKLNAVRIRNVWHTTKAWWDEWMKSRTEAEIIYANKPKQTLEEKLQAAGLK